jgi:hypothetical protein
LNIRSIKIIGLNSLNKPIGGKSYAHFSRKGTFKSLVAALRVLQQHLSWSASAAFLGRILAR